MIRQTEADGESSIDRGGYSPGLSRLTDERPPTANFQFPISNAKQRNAKGAKFAKKTDLASRARRPREPFSATAGNYDAFSAEKVLPASG